MKELKTSLTHKTDSYDGSGDVQSFSNVRVGYRLNEATNELELTNDVEPLQALVNSCKETALDRVLERFLPTTSVDDNIAIYDAMRDDLDYMTEAINVANNYRDKFNLSADMSIQDVFKYVENQSKTLKEKITKAQEPKMEVKNYSKELEYLKAQEEKLSKLLEEENNGKKKEVK